MQRSKIVIFASPRDDGNTKAAVELVLKGIAYEFINLSNLNISAFDYNHGNASDDFLPLIEKILNFDDIILASPVYWYSVSAQMKTFIDRWSDLLSLRKDLGYGLAGKNLWLICSFATHFPLGCASFESPIRMTCDYMNINYGGCFYYDSEHKPMPRSKEVIAFRQRLLSGDLSIGKILGKNLSLRLATLNDRRKLYEWMYTSDASKAMWGAPLFPEKPTKSWEDFKESWAHFYYQGPLTSRGHVFVIQQGGEDVGGIAFHKADDKNRSELDIWLRSEKDCGKGIGQEAIHLLCRYLYRQFGIMFFWAMPSARNPRSIATFQKIGFKPLPLSPAEGRQEFESQDYSDSVYLLKDMSLEDLR